LHPGESCVLDTEWLPTRSGSEFHGVSDAGILIRPLRAAPTQNGKVRLSGSFGVFYSGHLVAHLYDEHGRSLAVTQVAAVNPNDVVSLDGEVDSPGKTSRVSIHLVDASGVDRGTLQEVRVSAEDLH